MALNKTALALSLQTNIRSKFNGDQPSIEFCQALADAIVDTLTTSAVVTVVGVTPGVGTAVGTIS